MKTHATGRATCHLETKALASHWFDIPNMCPVMMRIVCSPSALVEIVPWLAVLIVAVSWQVEQSQWSPDLAVRL